MAICIECEHKIWHKNHPYNDFASGIKCNNTDLPCTDWVSGIRACEVLNRKGNCKGFKPIKDRGEK